MAKEAVTEKTDDEELLEEAKECFDQALDAMSTNHNRYEEDIRFGRMGEQWDANDAANRERDGRPMLIANRMPAFIRQVVNDAR